MLNIDTNPPRPAVPDLSYNDKPSLFFLLLSIEAFPPYFTNLPISLWPLQLVLGHCWWQIEDVRLN